jgi:orotate phosphoribosyltransferase
LLIQRYSNSTASTPKPSHPSPIALIAKKFKDYSECRGIVDTSLKGKNVLVIYNIIIVGTAIREIIKLVAKEGGKLVGFVVALDQVEKIPRLRE